MTEKLLHGAKCATLLMKNHMLAIILHPAIAARRQCVQSRCMLRLCLRADLSCMRQPICIHKLQGKGREKGTGGGQVVGLQAHLDCFLCIIFRVKNDSAPAF